jgi:hypothetical protein
LIWRGTSSGAFTVHGAHHLGKELQDRLGGQCSFVEKGKDAWKGVWALDVPHSVKIFIWRACNNLLPTGINLLKRKGVREPQMPLLWGRR